MQKKNSEVKTGVSLNFLKSVLSSELPPSSLSSGWSINTATCAL